jgi:mannosyl-oligosaccharide alpha-1,2-mannosidase
LARYHDNSIWLTDELYTGFDEYHPISKTGENMAPKGLGWIIIDGLDTAILMNLTSRVQDARQWISESLTWDQDQDVNTFETTIRMMGGLLSAHYLSNEYPTLAPLAEDDEGAAGEDLYLEKAKDLADRLMSAFDSPSGIPYASVNLQKFEGIPSHADMGASSTAEATTLQLEFKYLAKLTGEKDFWDRAEKVMKLVDDLGAPDGLVPIFIYATTGEFRGENIRLGSRGDSFYEYLIKQYLQTNKQEPVYQEMWNEALQGVRKHLITYTSNSKFTIIGERPSGLEKELSPKMDHLVCFMPGTIALAATEGLTEAQARKLPTWSKKKEEDMQLAHELMETCWGMYKYMATGLSAEITYFNIDNPPPAYGNARQGPVDFDPSPEAEWRKDFTVKSGDVHNLQRPETVESLFYMWRITNDNRYREWGWDMFKSFMNHTAVRNGGGFTSLRDANVVPPKVRDNMESFWLVSGNDSSSDQLNANTSLHRPKHSSIFTSCSHHQTSSLWKRSSSTPRDTRCLGLTWDSCSLQDGRESRGMQMARSLARLSRLKVKRRKPFCRMSRWTNTLDLVLRLLNIIGISLSSTAWRSEYWMGYVVSMTV